MSRAERDQAEAEIAVRVADIARTEEVIANLYERDAEITSCPDEDWYWDIGGVGRITLAEAIVALGRRVTEDQERIATLQARLGLRRQVG